MEERLTEHKLKTVIDGKLSRYFGVSAKEATKDQIYKAVVMSVRDIMLENGRNFTKRGRRSARSVSTTFAWNF